VVCLAALTEAVAAQEVLWQREGVVDQTQLGGPVAVLGDLDGDRFDDVANLAFSNMVSPPENRSQVWFLSGKDGSTLRVRRGYAGNVRFWNVARAGDVDGDGLSDYAVAIDDQSGSLVARVEVCSGRDDRILWSVTAPFGILFGLALAGDLDLDGDRRPDLLVAAPREGTGGALYAYDNKGCLLYKATGSWPGITIGRSVAKVGDVDGDRHDDFVTGGSEPGLRGALTLMSGARGSVLRTALSAHIGDDIGHSVACCGDLDADGVPDFVGGGGNTSNELTVQAFSGATAQPIWVATGTFGWALAGGADIDLDGVGDVVAGAPGELVQVSPQAAGAVHVLSGRDSARMLRFVGKPVANDGKGFHVAAFAPQPASPFAGYVATGPFWLAGGGGTLPWQGRMYMVRGNPLGVAGFGTACPGGSDTGSAPRIGLRDLGSAGVRIHLSGAPPAAPAFLLLGLSRTSWAGTPLPLRLDPFGFGGCELYTSIDALVPATTGTVGNDRGYAFVDVPLPLRGLPRAVVLHGQWVVCPGGLSAALQWTH
jgi:hypothetical protein